MTTNMDGNSAQAPKVANTDDSLAGDDVMHGEDQTPIDAAVQHVPVGGPVGEGASIQPGAAGTSAGATEATVGAEMAVEAKGHDHAVSQAMAYPDATGRSLPPVVYRMFGGDDSVVYDRKQNALSGHNGRLQIETDPDVGVDIRNLINQVALQA